MIFPATNLHFFFFLHSQPRLRTPLLLVNSPTSIPICLGVAGLTSLHLLTHYSYRYDSIPLLNHCDQHIHIIILYILCIYIYSVYIYIVYIYIYIYSVYIYSVYIYIVYRYKYICIENVNICKLIYIYIYYGYDSHTWLSTAGVQSKAGRGLRGGRQPAADPCGAALGRVTVGRARVAGRWGTHGCGKTMGKPWEKWWKVVIYMERSSIFHGYPLGNVNITMENHHFIAG